MLSCENGVRKISKLFPAYLGRTFEHKAGRQASVRLLMSFLFDLVVGVLFTRKHTGESILGIASEIL